MNKLYNALKEYFTSIRGLIFFLIFAQGMGMATFNDYWKFGTPNLIVNKLPDVPDSFLYVGYGFIALWFTIFIWNHLLFRMLQKQRLESQIAYYLTIGIQYYVFIRPFH